MTLGAPAGAAGLSHAEGDAMLRAVTRSGVLWLGAVAMIGTIGCAPAAEGQQTIVLKPGQDLAAFVAHAPEGTEFRFEPGIYRQQTIRPKNRQKFKGQDGVILTGAMVLDSWTNAADIWKQGGIPGTLPFHGECEDGGELCQFREDLFIDNRLYRRVEFFRRSWPRQMVLRRWPGLFD